MVIDGSRVTGAFTKTATVKTNDPARRQFTISISGKEISYMNVVPEGTVFLQGRYGEAVEKQLVLTTNEKDLDFKVLDVSSNIDDKITYTCTPTGNRGEYVLSVYKNPRLPTLTTYGAIKVRTNSKVFPETEIPVNVMTKGSISVSPITVNFGPVRFGDENGEGATVTKSVMLSKSSGSFKITDVTLNNPNYSAVTESINNTNQYRVLVTFRPPMRKQVRHVESAEMIIHTNDSLEPAIRVQVVARAM